MTSETTHIVLGATGHVGSAVARALLDRGETTLVVSRDPKNAETWRHAGAAVAIADVRDVEALRDVLRRGRRLFLLNSPAAPSGDAAAEERESLEAILAALRSSAIERIVAASTYGAQAGERLGDLGVLYAMEQALASQPIPAAVIRSAYYMSNWDAALSAAREHGTLSTFYPADFTLPMVAPADVGRLAATLLTSPTTTFGPRAIEGPQRYSPADVAAALGVALGRPVRAVPVPRDTWATTLAGMGFSPASAESFIAMTAATLDSGIPSPADAIRGETSLRQYVSELVHR